MSENAVAEALRALLTWADAPTPSCASNARELFKKDLAAANAALHAHDTGRGDGTTSSVCLQCGKEVNTAQKNFATSIYGAIEIYTVAGPSAIAAPLGSWCGRDHLITWMHERMDPKQVREDLEEATP